MKSSSRVESVPQCLVIPCMWVWGLPTHPLCLEHRAVQSWVSIRRQPSSQLRTGWLVQANQQGVATPAQNTTHPCIAAAFIETQVGHSRRQGTHRQNRKVASESPSHQPSRGQFPSAQAGEAWSKYGVFEMCKGVRNSKTSSKLPS